MRGALRRRSGNPHDFDGRLLVKTCVTAGRMPILIAGAFVHAGGQQAGLIPALGRGAWRAAEGPAGRSVMPPAAGHRVLVVEDDPAVAEVAVAVVESMGHVAVLRHDAPSALALLRSGEDVDLVFSDIVMPGGMSGTELAEAIAAEFPGLPVLLATGFSTAALGPGAVRVPVLAKPYSVSQLTGHIAGLLRPPA